ncbi:hypothetical protein BD777DRAFT_132522 [Yarrowia lipolytica]|nr:hypothetical protein BD777DRAFT_132522 [Yarrowia lipolytica]
MASFFCTPHSGVFVLDPASGELSDLTCTGIEVVSDLLVKYYYAIDLIGPGQCWSCFIGPEQCWFLSLSSVQWYEQYNGISNCSVLLTKPVNGNTNIPFLATVSGGNGFGYPKQLPCLSHNTLVLQSLSSAVWQTARTLITTVREIAVDK